MPLSRKFRYWAAASLAVLLLAIATTGYARSTYSDRVITNIAAAQWRIDDALHETQSNEVRIRISTDVASIQTFVPDPSGTAQFIVPPSICGGSDMSVNQDRVIGFGTDISYLPTTTLRVGQALIIRVIARGSNLDPNQIDSIDVRLASPAGDEERLTMRETSANSGEFAGSIATTSIPPVPVARDCVLSLRSGDHIDVSYVGQDGTTVVSTRVDAVAPSNGLIFDSQNGVLVSGARVTLIDTATGAPASVFAEDGATMWPSTVISGEAVTDASGRVFAMSPGEYRFPIVAPGSYRVEVLPPAPYQAPSSAEASEIAQLARPDGDAFIIFPASYGQQLDVFSSEFLGFDIPLDRTRVGVRVSKSVSRAIALPGDIAFYTITIENPDSLAAKTGVVLTDSPSPYLRFRPDSVRIDGEQEADSVTFRPDGGQLQISIGDLAAGSSLRITYAMAVRADAPEGVATNDVVITDALGIAARASANLRISRETIGSRMVLMGRITEGSCYATGERRGIPGVRVMLEDGSFAITDSEGRYHFEGLSPGTHVVQAQLGTLPDGGEFLDCSSSTANAGSANSRFVRGQGGSLVTADFYAKLPEGWLSSSSEIKQETASDAVAAGAEIDWSEIGDGPAEFLFPTVGHNPRAPAVRVAIRHEIGEVVELRSNGELVDPLAFEGVTKSEDQTFAVSVWRGVPLASERTLLSASIAAENAQKPQLLEREVFFSGAPAQAELVADLSQLIADGRTKPVIAVRITDRKGRPVRSGVMGNVAINAPYQSARALEAMQLHQLTGRGSSDPVWTIEGDDGIAFVELAPTMVSGQLQLEFNFTDGEISRRHQIESWITPGDQEWTIVGLAEGSFGARTIADNMEASEEFDSMLGEEGRVAFYAKGRVLGKFLLTAAFDSAKQRNEQRLEGAIDPQAYYTVFADGSTRQFDAASRERLYLRIETDTFYAIYGDFRTGFDQTDLGRYERAVTGFKAEGRFGDLHLKGFLAETETLFRRDEFQGNGLSGPYRLSSRFIVPNSESIFIEVRDRFRSQVIVESRQLSRFIDYDIDLLSGTVRFREPVLSRDFDLNPRFIVVEYEIDELQGTGEFNAGLRGDVSVTEGALRLGSTIVTDQGEGSRTDLAAIDVRARLGGRTELRTEAATSVRDGEVKAAFQVEAQHHSGDVDLIAFARTIEPGFGVGQQNAAEEGRQKVGVDARFSISERAALTASAWHDDSLVDDARRNALQLKGSLRGNSADIRVGLAHFDDRYRDGGAGSSTVLEAGARHRVLGNRLELNADTSIALQATGSIDLPTRHRFGARYSLTNDLRIVGAYEIADGEKIRARTLKGGVEISPWTGARVTGMLGRQEISEFGPRTYAAFGMAQSVPLTTTLTMDATVDINRQLRGGDPSTVINPDHPSADGGHLGQGGELFEDFSAVTIGGNWRMNRWAANGRFEYRDGEDINRKGVALGAIRQVGEGSVLGSGFTWTSARGANGAVTEVFDGGVAAAHRPADSNFAFLAKLEYRSDIVRGAELDAISPIGSTALTIDGDASSRRVIGSLSTNWSPKTTSDDGAGYSRKSEFGLFVGGRYSLDSLDGFGAEGFTLLAGLDARIGIADRIEFGGRASVRSNLTEGYHSFSAGPEVGFVPAEDIILSVGYNVIGFRDEDFSAARKTDEGLYAGMRIKFDADTFSSLGLGR